MTPEESKQMKERRAKQRAEQKKKEDAYRAKHLLTVKVGDNMVYDDFENGEHQVLKVVTRADLVKNTFKITLADLTPLGDTEYGKVYLEYDESDGIFYVKGRNKEAYASTL